MKNFTTLLALFCLGFHSLFAQSLTFDRRYNVTGYNDARGIVATPDHGFVFTGLSKDAKDPLGDMYLSKINAAGALVWTQYYGREKEDGGNAVLATSDGGYLLTGHTAFSYGSDCDGYLVKTDAAGNEEWRAFIGTAYDDVCSSSIQLEDGSYLVTGKIENPQSHLFQIMLAKLAPNGRQIFMKMLETNLPAVGYKIAASGDGNVFISGYTYLYDEHAADPLLVKCTPEGAIRWETRWITEENDRAYSLLPLPDGGALAVGGTIDAADQSVQMRIWQVDAYGTITDRNNSITDKGFGGLYDILSTPSGEIAVAGILSPEVGVKAQPVMGFLDERLQVQTWLHGNYTASCRTRCLAQSASGDFVLAGNMQEPDTYGVFVSKMRGPEVGNITNVAEAPFLLFPNPFRDFFYLKTGVTFQSKLLTITTAEGKIVRNITFDQPEIVVPREGLPAGRYFFSVRDDKGNVIRTGKLSAE